MSNSNNITHRIKEIDSFSTALINVGVVVVKKYPIQVITNIFINIFIYLFNYYLVN